jgi:proline racemase
MSSLGQSRHFDRSPFASGISAETDTPGLGAKSQIRQVRTWTHSKLISPARKAFAARIWASSNILELPDVVPREA